MKFWQEVHFVRWQSAWIILLNREFWTGILFSARQILHLLASSFVTYVFLFFCTMSLRRKIICTKWNSSPNFLHPLQFGSGENGQAGFFLRLKFISQPRSNEPRLDTLIWLWSVKNIPNLSAFYLSWWNIPLIFFAQKNLLNWKRADSELLEGCTRSSEVCFWLDHF